MEQLVDHENEYNAIAIKALLKEIEPYPELRNGVTDFSHIQNNLNIVGRLLSSLFPAALTNNEIKAVTMPFYNIVINRTERLKKILKDAGPGFDLTIRNFDEHQFYVMCCCLILNKFYNTNLDFSNPLFYDIPNAQGMVKHYRLLYNADFIEIFPTEKAKKLTQVEVEFLINNYDNLDLWKQMFPKESYILKGFAIMTLFDATVDNAVSSLKGALLRPSQEATLQENFEAIFRSIYGIADLKIGFTAYNQEENNFSIALFAQKIKSYILSYAADKEQERNIFDKLYNKIIKEQQFFAVSDTAKFLTDHPDNDLATHLSIQNIQSFILAPIIKNDVLLGVLELVSSRPRELNSVNANKLEAVMPFLIDTIERQNNFVQNQLQAIIQNEYTTLHPSVQWKFKKEAENFIKNSILKTDYVLKEIVFENVYPLYGQVDIVSSSDSRNLSVQKDLNVQISLLIDILNKIQAITKDKLADLQQLSKLKSLIDDFSIATQTDMEQDIVYFIETKIHPIFKQFSAKDQALQKDISNYFKQLDKKNGSLFYYRQKYDKTISTINQKMAALLDERQIEAQEIFPHYYERFKSDGVEHNIYIGASIAPSQTFDLGYLYKLRLWQLQVLCEMEREHHKIKFSLPYLMEVTTLVLAFSFPISIRFRMDEKRFDVDGTYNARFEIVKKRIDKAFIKNTQERITKAGYLTIVYSNKVEQKEYIKYLKVLQAKNYLSGEPKLLEVQDLQSITGLKVLRIKILHEDSELV
ncbi:MAG: GAF domain-containing protein [Janthinobacterium lividum]